MWFYLDDERGLPSGSDAILVPDYDSMIRTINMCVTYRIPLYIDFDYDIGDPYYSGARVAQYIVDNRIPMLGYHIHSSNQEGSRRIREILSGSEYEEI